MEGVIQKEEIAELEVASKPASTMNAALDIIKQMKGKNFSKEYLIREIKCKYLELEGEICWINLPS